MIFSVGEFNLSVYGVMCALALVAMYFCISVVRDYTKAFHKKHTSMYMIYALLTAFAFSRITYVVSHSREYYGDFIAILFVWRGGYTLFAALVGFTLAAVAYARINRIGVMNFLNVIAIGLVLFTAISRLSEGSASAGKPFISGFPKIFTYTDIYQTVRHMPSAYEGLFNLALFLYIGCLFKKTKKVDGLFIRGALIYCCVQLPFESLRDGSPMFETIACAACVVIITLTYAYKLFSAGARLRFALIRALIALISLASVMLLYSRASGQANLELNCVWLFVLSALTACACLSMISNSQKREKSPVTHKRRSKTIAM